MDQSQPGTDARPTPAPMPAPTPAPAEDTAAHSGELRAVLEGTERALAPVMAAHVDTAAALAALHERVEHLEHVEGVERADGVEGADGVGGVPEDAGEDAGGQPGGRTPDDRSQARALFAELNGLPQDSPQRAELRDRLVRMHLPMVEHLARRFRNRGEPLDDLAQVATIGLIRAVDRFDAGRGMDFTTYATATVVGEIKRHFRDQRQPAPASPGHALRAALTRATGELSRLHGRAPTVHELAAHLGISEQEVLDGLDHAPGTPGRRSAFEAAAAADPGTGLDDDLDDLDGLDDLEDGDLDGDGFDGDFEGEVPAGEAGAGYRELLGRLLEQLPPREKQIVRLRFFARLSVPQIAAEVGVSPRHVSRLLARTLARLREQSLIEE
jgi:RNA polymerase sigma-B factor